MIVKTFYYFPYKKEAPYILYDNSLVFKSNIFKALYNKAFGSNTWKLIARKSFVCTSLFELLFKKKVLVPHENVRVIYQGYDNKFHFVLDKNLRVDKLFKEKDYGFVDQSFLGNTLCVYNYSELKKQAPALEALLKKRWQDLLAGKIKNHGDLTPFNICINNNIVSLIDSKTNVNDSIIFDFLYLYAYSLERIKKRNFLSKKEKNKLTSLLEEVILSVFQGKDYKIVIRLSEEIELENDFTIKGFDKYRYRFVNLLRSTE